MQKPPDIRKHRIELDTEVKLSFPDISGFANAYSSNLSLGGMFIRSEVPQPIGSVLHFEFLLDDNSSLIKGTGEVAWVRRRSQGPTQPPGMGVRFKALDEGGRQLILELMEKHLQAGGEPFDIRSTPEAQVPQPLTGEGPLAGATSAGRTVDAPAAGSAPPLPSPAGAAAPQGGGSPKPAPPSLDGLLSARDKAPSPAAAHPLVAAGQAPIPAPPGRPELLPAAGVAKGSWYARSSPAFLGVGLILLLALAGAGYLFVKQLQEVELLELSDVVLAADEVAPTPSLSPEESDVPTLTRTDGSPVAGGTTNGSPEAHLTLVESIGVELEAGTTLLRIEGNGSFTTTNYNHFRLDARPYREIIRILGINQPFSPARLDVETPHIQSVRVGFHPRAAANELHVVLDLKGQQARVTRIQPQGGTLLVYLN